MIRHPLFDIVLVHLLFEDIRDDRSKLLTLFFRQFSRVLSGCIQLRILTGDPLDVFCRCVLSHEEGEIVTSEGVHNKAAQKLHTFEKCMFRHFDYYNTNSLISSSFDFLRLVIDNWFPIT